MKIRRSMIVWFFVGAAVSASWLAWSRATQEQPHTGDPDPAQGARHETRTPEEAAPTDHTERATAALAVVEEKERLAELADSLSRWAQDDGAAAIAWAESSIPEEDLPKVLFDALAEWIVQDTDSMLQWYLGGLDEHGVHRIDVKCPDPYIIGEQVVSWLALIDPVRAATFLYRDLYRDGTRSFLYSEPGRDLSSALTTGDEFRLVCAALVPYYEKHGRHLSETDEILSRWCIVDPDGAAEFLDLYPAAPPRPPQIAARAMEESVAGDAVENAERLLGEIGVERGNYGSTLANILGHWPKDDLPRAIAWLAEQGESEKTLAGRSTLAVRLVESDPAAAFDLLEPIPEGEKLERATEQVLESWASRSLDEALAFLRGQEESWPAEKISRLRELALTARGAMGQTPN